MGKALEKLLARTSGQKTKKPRKKAKPVVKINNKKRNLARIENAGGEDARQLKLEILQKLNHKVTFTKKQKVPGQMVLPPGLAPIGYDPDESDEDEPY